MNSFISNDNNMYLVIGRAESWTSDLQPPSPTSANDEEIFLRRNAIFFKKISQQNMSLVIPKNIWTEGVRYRSFNHIDLQPDTVIVNDENIQSVYMCVHSPLDENKKSYICPQFSLVRPVDYIINHDGYTWILLYQLSETDLYHFETTEWIPLPTDYQIDSSSLQAYIMRESKFRSIPPYDFNSDFFINTPVNGFGASPEYQLGAKHVIISSTLQSNELGLPSQHLSYRQIGLWVNPQEKIYNRTAVKNIYLANEINLASGQIIYFENRMPIYRNPAQSENFKIILEF